MFTVIAWFVFVFFVLGALIVASGYWFPRLNKISDTWYLIPELKKQKGLSKKEYLEQRLAEWRVVIPRVLAAEIHLEESDVTQIKINPTTGDYKELLPNDEEWYIPFWLDILEILPPSARIRFVDIHKDNIIYSDKETR